jgi:hypothetical protein
MDSENTYENMVYYSDRVLGNTDLKKITECKENEVSRTSKLLHKEKPCDF